MALLGNPVFVGDPGNAIKVLGLHPQVQEGWTDVA